MPSIKIIAVPPGFAPLDIRKEWVGVEIPLPASVDDPPGNLRTGTANIGGYTVRKPDAIEALRKAGKEEAAKWWASSRLGLHLQFKREACQFIP